MGRAFKIVLAFLAGLIVGEAIPVVWYIVATTYFGVFDRDGGGAMGAIFIMGPILAAIVGTAAAIVTARRTVRSRLPLGQKSGADSATPL